MLNPDISCLENSVDTDHHNVKVDYRLWVFNFRMNLTNEKNSFSEDRDLGIFDSSLLIGEKHTFFSDFATCTSCIFCA